MSGRGWVGEASRRGAGTRYPNPAVKGEQVRVQPGNINDPTPIKKGPYVVISRGGKKIKVPLAGNPTLPQ